MIILVKMLTILDQSFQNLDLNLGLSLGSVGLKMDC
jgi:hypothetical protein